MPFIASSGNQYKHVGEGDVAALYVENNKHCFGYTQ